jgi:hypothetical protein
MTTIGYKEERIGEIANRMLLVLSRLSLEKYATRDQNSTERLSLLTSAPERAGKS